VHQTPKDALLSGSKILDPVMSRHGFAFHLEGEGKGSGGDFARGRYRRLDRALELHYRWDLGLVTYHIGDAELDHEAYMRCLGVWGENRYPGFPKIPLESFGDLAHDLKAYCYDFLSGDGREFLTFAAELRRDPSKFKGIPL
jgi:hypothetical protein